MAITLVVPLLGISSCALVGFNVFRNCLEYSARQPEIEIEYSGHFKYRHRKLYQKRSNNEFSRFPHSKNYNPTISLFRSKNQILAISDHFRDELKFSANDLMIRCSWIRFEIPSLLSDTQSLVGRWKLLAVLQFNIFATITLYHLDQIFIMKNWARLFGLNETWTRHFKQKYLHREFYNTMAEWQNFSYLLHNFSSTSTEQPNLTIDHERY